MPEPFSQGHLLPSLYSSSITNYGSTRAYIKQPVIANYICRRCTELAVFATDTVTVTFIVTQTTDGVVSASAYEPEEPGFESLQGIAWNVGNPFVSNRARVRVETKLF